VVIFNLSPFKYGLEQGNQIYWFYKYLLRKRVMEKDSLDNEILYAGEPPLKRRLAELLQQVIERGLDSPLTDEQQTVFEQQLIDEWKRGPESRAGLENTAREFGTIVKQLNSLPPAKQPFGWQEVGRQLYIYAEKNGKDDPVGQLILKTYSNKKSLLVSGNPPLSRQAAECYLEMSAFFHSLVKRTQLTLPPEKREEAVSELVRQFPSLSEETKDQISQADILWGVLRYNWKIASRTEREQFRQELMLVARPAGQEQKSAEAASDEAPSETSNEPVAEAPSPASAETLSKNSKFIEAVNRLRLSVPKGSPFQFRKR
jgi:hypothetical protein